MLKTAAKRYVTNQLLLADIQLNGERPWDIQIHDERFFPRLIYQGSLGLGESYMEGWIDAARLDECIRRILQSNLARSYNPQWRNVFYTLGSRLLNKQSERRALMVGKQHYDLSNELFEYMLDKRMVYSCGYWKNAQTLDEAQEAKLDLICRKLELKPGMKILDIGCGWGGLAKYAAEKYDVKVVGITISQNQLELASQRCKGLPVELRFQDYRDVQEKFDRIVSVGQMEHVGYKNFYDYFKMVSQCLTDDGLFLLHTIGNNISSYRCDPWFDKYIFPNGMLPSASQLTSASEGLLVMEDWHSFGPDYDKTLMAWVHNFDKHWPSLKDNYDEKFYRMWRYYLLVCAGAFRARAIQLWQVVYSKKGIRGGYDSIR